MELNLTYLQVSKDEKGIVFPKPDTVVLRVLDHELPRLLNFLQNTSSTVSTRDEILHELKNLLVPILGLTQVLARDPELNKWRDTLQLILLAANDAACILKRAQAERFLSSIDLADLLAEVANLLTNEAEKKSIIITRELALGLRISGDSTSLRQVFVNLVQNAMEAMPQGGTITIRLLSEENGTLVEVEDNGEGMSKEVLEKCMEISFSTKNSSGLGLDISRRIIQHHQGTMEVDSIKAKGTTVRILFTQTDSVS